MTSTSKHRHTVIERAIREALPGYDYAITEPYRTIGQRVIAALPALVRDTDDDTIAAVRADLGPLLDAAGVRDEGIAATEHLLPTLPAGAGDDWPLVQAISDVMRGRGARRMAIA